MLPPGGTVFDAEWRKGQLHVRDCEKVRSMPGGVQMIKQIEQIDRALISGGSIILFFAVMYSRNFLVLDFISETAWFGFLIVTLGICIFFGLWAYAEWKNTGITCKGDKPRRG
jgi:hypothetical protein